MVKLTSYQKGYIAAIIDGEGCIGIVCTTPKRGYKSKRPMYQLRLRVTNTDYRLVKWLKDSIGYGHIAERKRKHGKPNWSNVYIYSIVSHKAKELLRLIYPYLVIKKEQADIAIEFCKTLLKQKNNKYGCTGLTNIILNERKELKNRINFLNRRSKDCVSEKGREFGGRLTANTEPSIMACVETMGDPRKG